ncbi:MAG: PhzF family phenazine biosynthesis protein [Myxococcaceae bacterium]|nr:PhzF family phenazine biosynthesis protein [Myxococcaceae bacterium]MCI0673609.1 PhzF family phenazine biosynthesis protein [Myxococcaceae bacterium]
MTPLLRYTAFTTAPSGGNPAGIVLDATGLDDARMLALAASLGYSETAFVFPGPEPRRFAMRYFSPLAEVPFCGHATIAASVALAERLGAGPLSLDTAAGRVEVATGEGRASLTSVPTWSRPAPEALLSGALQALRWKREELDPRYPAHVAYAGAQHLVIAAGTRRRLAELDYAFDALAALMRAAGLTTVHLFHERAADVFDARNPFPVGGVVEDPATGAAAAAFGGYLRALGRVDRPRTLVIHQGEDLGRPSVLVVDVDPTQPRVTVTGSAVSLDETAGPRPAAAAHR